MEDDLFLFKNIHFCSCISMESGRHMHDCQYSIYAHECKHAHVLTFMRYFFLHAYYHTSVHYTRSGKYVSKGDRGIDRIRETHHSWQWYLCMCTETCSNSTNSTYQIQALWNLVASQGLTIWFDLTYFTTRTGSQTKSNAFLGSDLCKEVFKPKSVKNIINIAIYKPRVKLRALTMLLVTFMIFITDCLFFFEQFYQFIVWFDQFLVWFDQV